jgi:PKD repeat protein
MDCRALTHWDVPARLFVVIAWVISMVSAGWSTTAAFSAPATNPPLSLCGNKGPAPSAPGHVIVVMLENLSYNQVVGSANAPYQTSLASQCGNATSFFSATHSSAANYLAVSAGQYPAKSTAGCGSVKACSDASDNLYNQLTTAGSTGGGFMESMPSPCDPTSYGKNTPAHDLYSIGHNPIIYYSDIPSSSCQATDLGVPDLTSQSGAFWSDLQNRTLPAFSFVTPNAANNGEGPGTPNQNEQTADTWLRNFIGTVQQSNSYQAGNTMVLVTYDEGNGSDKANAENCTNESLDMPVTNGVSAHQDSCHVPLFVVDPYTPAGSSDPTFFDHYSITRTVEDLFGLPYLAHAADAQTNSLLGHFGIPEPTTANPPPTVSITTPTPNATVAGTTGVTGTATSAIGLAQVQVGIDGGPLQPASGTTSWSSALGTTSLADGDHSIIAQATDSAGAVATQSVSVNVNNQPPVASAASSCVSLSCTFDGSSSSDPGSTLTGYAWTFGDGTTGSGPAPAHTYASAGIYTYTLTVTDAQDLTSATAFQNTVTATAPSTAPITYRGAARSYTASARTASGASVTAPSTVAAGDTELLFASSSTVGSTAAPAGWRQIAQQTSSPLQVTVYSHTALAADAGANVKVPVSATTSLALQLIDYSGVGATGITETGSSDSASVTHIAPAATVSATGSWVVSYWTDKSSTTTAWNLPATLTSRDADIGTGGGHITDAIADSGGSVTTGAYPSRLATVTGGPSGKGAALTLILQQQS